MGKLRQIKEIMKKFKGIKNLIMLKCDNCESPDITLVPNTLQYKDTQEGGSKFKSVLYAVRCNKCNSVGYINELWLIKK